MQSLSTAVALHSNAAMESFSSYSRKRSLSAVNIAPKETEKQNRRICSVLQLETSHITLNCKIPEQYKGEFFLKLKISISGVMGSDFWFFTGSTFILAYLQIVYPDLH